MDTSLTDSSLYSELSKQEKEESLLSETSLRASLAPPRAPPYFTANRSLYAKKDPSGEGMALHHHHDHRHHNRNQGLHPQKRDNFKYFHNVLTKIHKANFSNFHLIHHHPHLSFSPESPDQITRYISSHIMPLGMQNKLRDNGTFRSLSDMAVTSSVPCMGIVNPRAAMNFLFLTKHMIQLDYGFGHPSQKIHLFLPSSPESPGDINGISASSSDNNHVNEKSVKGLVFFVHGGAWGSGCAWMYRLVALPFVKANIAVAIVGYRTYPDGNVQDQVDDLYSAARMLQMKYPHLWQRRGDSKRNEQKEEISRGSSQSSFGVCLMGHSSGAHISMLLMVQQVEKKVMNLMSGSQGDKGNDDTISFDSFIGLSGVYNIQHHFDYEAGRGVEEISPMKPACGYTREAFDYYSPALRIHRLTKMYNDSTGINADSIMSELIPPVLLVHGMDDETVPFTSTSEAARIMRSCGAQYCSEYYLSETGHTDVIMHFMMGGRSKDAVMRWLEGEVFHGNKQADIGLPSKL